MKRAIDISSYLDDILNTKNIEDYSFNGLQLESENDIENVYCGVDASLDFFKKAKEPKNSLFITHHGIFWKDNNPSIKDSLYNKIKYLLDNNSSLYASHLPLDMHSKYGNNVSLLKFIGIKEDSFKPFGIYHGNYISYSGEFENSVEIEAISSKLKEIASDKIYSFPFGKKSIKTVGVVSGGGSFAGAECKNKNIDLFITGEGSHELYNYAKDSQLSVIFATHYATEIFGVMNLGKLINNKFGISFTFIDFKPIF